MDELYEDTLLSNIDDEDRELVIEAAKQSGFGSIVYIIDTAYCSNGRVLSGNFGLHTSRRDLDHSKFWRKFDELRNNQGGVK